jgi:acyl-coenzyme A synthetase/AMP-(fatty) acid ligase
MLTMTNGVPAAVRARCHADPAASAIVTDTGSTSYGTLLGLLDSALVTLRTAGVSPGDTVVVRARRVAQLPVAVLAVWEAGAAVALVDATLPPARLDVCDDVVRPAWRLTFDSDGAWSVAPTGLAQDARRVSHILFTSGTIGSPAAVEVTGDAFDRAFDGYLRLVDPRPTDRVALLAGTGHDPVLRDMFVPLVRGGTLVVSSADVVADPDRLAAFLGTAGVTILHCSPALLEILLAGARDDRPRHLAGIRLVVSGGAPLSWGTVRRLRASTDAVIVNAYGTTETPQVASCWVVPDQPQGYPGDDVGVGIGSGFGDTELLLVDPQGQPAAARGEVLVRSRNLARGYLPGAGRDRRFVPDPHGIPGYAAYRTGDLGERDETGSIRIVGRLDRQVSVNGFRVEPEEIERAALRHSGVVQAVAGLLCAPTGDVIELSVVPSAPDALAVRDLRAFLRASLPRHAIPTSIRVVPRLTLDANHKAKPYVAVEGSPS